MMITNQTSRSRACTAASDARSERGIVHRPRNAGQGKLAVLRGGSEILVRQIQDADLALLADVFARLLD